MLKIFFNSQWTAEMLWNRLQGQNTAAFQGNSEEY